MDNKNKSKLLVGLVAGIPGAAVLAATLATTFVKIEVEEKDTDKETIDQLNSLIGGLKFSTLSEVVNYFNDYLGINLEELKACNKNQYVWDKDANVIFTMKTNGTVASAPDGYELNKDKSKIWKMVSLNTSLLSSKKNISAQIDSFKTSCEYGQYIRKSNIPSTYTINFSTSVDTGLNAGCALNYKAPSSAASAPMVVTNRSTLKIEGSISDIDHYGSAVTVTVTDPANINNKYNEYGTVDNNIVVENAVVVAQPGSEINTVYVNDVSKVPEGTKVVEVKGKTEEDPAAVVGTVATTENVPTQAEDLVETDTEHGAEKPAAKDQEEIPTPASRYAGGYGTEASPYIIDNQTRLENCRTDVENANGAYLYFKLTQNITLAYANGETWTPIGATKDKPFRGGFDGNGFTISNVKLSKACSDEESGFGFFGYTNGDKNEAYKGFDTIWDSTNKHIILDNITQENYKTYVKNLTLDKVDIQYTGKAYCVAGLIGGATNTFIYNNTVKSGTISGYKHVGGITGSMAGSIIMGCMSGSNEENTDPLNITATVYNVGGISGSCDRDAVVGSYTSTAYVGCETGKNTTVTALSNSGGGIGGIFAYNGNTYCCLVDGCVNNAKIVSTCEADPNDSWVGGILGFGQEPIVANCINYGEVCTAENSKAGSIAGISILNNKLVHQCYNYGYIHGYATHSVAGVIANAYRDITISSCGNEGELLNINTTPVAKTADIVSGIQDVITIEGVSFANVNEISTMFASMQATSLKVTFKNCSVTDSTGSLVLPIGTINITSDTHLFDNVNVDANTTSLTIDMPNTNITVSQETTAVINVTSADSSITIAEGGKVKTAIVSGANSKIINNGEVTNILAIDGEATYGENNGTCRTIFFGYKTSTGVDAKVVNNGTIKVTADESAEYNNPVYVKCLWASGKELTLENHGIIQYDNNSLATPADFFYLLNPVNFVYKAYAGSQTLSNVHKWIGFNGYGGTKAKLMYQDGYVLKENDTDLTYVDLANEYTGGILKVTAEQFE